MSDVEPVEPRDAARLGRNPLELQASAATCENRDSTLFGSFAS